MAEKKIKTDWPLTKATDADKQAAENLHDRLFGEGRGRGKDKPTHAAVISPPR